MAKTMFRRSGDAYNIQFSINGEIHTVYDTYPATTSLNDYIRDVAGLKGTKVMCREAGCGCCAVTVTQGCAGDKVETMSINSCICPLYSVDGWQITTTEGIGNQKDGFHPIQQQIAKHNATQCGYCTPGFVMSMYGLLHQNPKPTQQEIEDSFDGHICRCTGYRSILDAMKTFGSDSSVPDAKPIDIEDLNKHLCPKTGEKCKKETKSSCSLSQAPSSLGTLALDLRESKWFRPATIKELGNLLVKNKSKTIKLLFGNTSTGIFKYQEAYDIYVDLHNVQELYQYKETANSVTFGANTTLTKLKEHMKNLQYKSGFFYCTRIIRHLKVLASVLVRNAGCIAGNLMIKHTHPEFPSDLFTMMEAIGAHVGIYDSSSGKTTKHTLLEFLQKVKMAGKVLAFIEIPKFEETDIYRSFKITPRWQNAHAYVNAAFKLQVEKLVVKTKPSFVFGGINAETVHATKTEEFLKGKTLSDAVIKETLKVLSSELKPSIEEPPTGSAKYRHDLAVNLLYKTLLEVAKPTDPKIRSGADSMERSLSSGLQTFQEKKNEFPLKQAMPKLEAPIQTSGETVYTNDIPSFQRELCGAFVISNIASGTILNVDTSEALAIPGVVKFISAADIPEGGKNNFMSVIMFPHIVAEEVFVTKNVEYAGQSIGLILAETQVLADHAARKVKVTYGSIQEPLVYVQDGVAKGSLFEEQKTEIIIGQPDEAYKDSEMTVTGEVYEGSQYYYYIENQISIAVPSEDGIDVYASTQMADINQKISADIIGKPLNYINMIGSRVGGAFGGKALYSSLMAASATLASYVTKRPVRLMVNMSTNMKLIGKRFPLLGKYKAGLNRDGKMQVIDVELFVDNGFRPPLSLEELAHMLDQGYFVPNWKIHVVAVKTNKPTSQACRGPGSLPAAFVMESIMEHAAKELNKHPILFKEINLYEKGQKDISGVVLDLCTMRDVWQRLKQTAQVENRMREVENFNRNNLWRKRGITMTAVKYGMLYFPPGHAVNVSIFVGDGTVSVMATGTEMGQGLFTKVSQAVAKTLNIPLDFIKVRPLQNNTLPNPLFTGGSTASEMCVLGAINACNQLNERIQPIREKMPDAPWPAVLAACNFSCIDLSAKGTSGKIDNMFRYHTYCAGVVESEVDVLTGEYQIKRVDIMADFGESINPTIDIGQMEGGFVMGLGAFLSEDLHYNKRTGELLNDGTWEYKPPTTKDIPIDWRVHFLPDSPNPVGILSSKAVGEPPVGLAMGALLSIKSAVESVREELTGKREFIPVVAPYTVERAQLDTKIVLDHLRVGQLAS